MSCRQGAFSSPPTVVTEKRREILDRSSGGVLICGIPSAFNRHGSRQNGGGTFSSRHHPKVLPRSDRSGSILESTQSVQGAGIWRATATRAWAICLTCLRRLHTTTIRLTILARRRPAIARIAQSSTSEPKRAEGRAILAPILRDSVIARWS